MTCFWAVENKPEVTLTIDLEWKTGVAAKDWPNVAKKGQVDVSIQIYNIFSSWYFFSVFCC